MTARKTEPCHACKKGLIILKMTADMTHEILNTIFYIFEFKGKNWLSFN